MGPRVIVKKRRLPENSSLLPFFFQAVGYCSVRRLF
ncbi:MAG: hypothetical protein ACJA1E_001501 [Paracoccaceae bacterium]|jgi:hypothetical protein